MFEMKKLVQAIVLSSMALSSVIYAQEFVPADETTVVVEQQSAAMSADAGVQAVTEAAAKPYVQTSPAEFVSAADQLETYMREKGWSGAWDLEKKRMFVVASESFDVEDPSYDTAFISKRSMYATLATMKAKAQVVEFMRTQMSATDQLSAPGTDVYEQLNQDYRRQTTKISRQQEQLVKLLREVDTAEADQLAGVTWNDLSKEALAAAIKKLDNSFQAGDIEQKKLKTYEKAKVRYQEALAELQKIERNAAAIQGDVKLDASSTVETLAKAPIMGAVLLAQAESWDAEEEEYQVAVLLVWSEKLEQAAESILAGKPVKTKPRQGKTIGQWAQEQDLATMVGSRQFVDKNGLRWYLGAYGSLLDRSSSAKRAARGRADLFAKKELAVALFADLETQKQAAIAMQTRNAGIGGKDVTTIAESFAEKTRQSIKDRQVSGASKLLSRTVNHPVTGQKMYVSVYAISADSAASAMESEARNYARAIESAKNNAYQQGVKQSFDQQMNAAMKDETALRQGQLAGKASIAGEAQGNKEPVTTAVQSVQIAPVKSKMQSGGSTASQTVFSSPDVNDDDF